MIVMPSQQNNTEYLQRNSYQHRIYNISYKPTRYMNNMVQFVSENRISCYFQFISIQMIERMPSVKPSMLLSTTLAQYFNLRMFQDTQKPLRDCDVYKSTLFRQLH